METRRIPVEITTIRTSAGGEQRVPRVPLGVVLARSDFDVQKATEQFARHYWQSVEQGKNILEKIKEQRLKTRRVTPYLYWELGDFLLDFIQQDKRGMLYLNGVKSHFCRDLRISGPSWTKILRFRTLVPSERHIDPSKDWKFYRDAPTRTIKASVDAMTARVAKAKPARRSRIEIHLPLEAMSTLQELAERASKDKGRKITPAAMARVLLVAAMDTSRDPLNSWTWERLLSKARRILLKTAGEQLRLGGE